MTRVVLMAGALVVLGRMGADGAPVTALAFSPDGGHLVSGRSRAVAWHSGDDGIERRRVPLEMPKIAGLAFHPGGHGLVAVGGTPRTEGVVHLLDGEDGRRLASLVLGDEMVQGVAFSGDGGILGVAGGDGVVRFLRLLGEDRRWEVVATGRGHVGPVLGVALAPAGDTAVSVGADRSVKVWSVGDGRMVRTFTHHTDAVQAVAFRPVPDGIEPAAGWVCATGGSDRTVRIWQPAIGRMVRIVRHHEGAVLALAYAPDGTALYSAGEEGVVRRLDPDSDRIRARWEGDGEWIHALAMHPDGRRLASGDWAGRVRIWAVGNGGDGVKEEAAGSP